jgi:hypothetical protein
MESQGGGDGMRSTLSTTTVFLARLCNIRGKGGGEDFRPRSSRMSVCALRAVRRSTLFAGGEIARRDSVEFQARVFLYTGGVFNTKQLPFPL